MHVLVFTQRLPYAPNRGDRVRMYHLLKLLRGIAEVTLVSLVHDEAEAAEADRLSELVERVETARVAGIRRWAAGVLTLPTGRPLTHALLASPAFGPIVDRIAAAHPPDVVLAYCSGVAQYALRPSLAGVPLVVDMVDVDSFKWAAYAATASWPMRWVYEREARTLGLFERRLLQQACATAVVNEKERAALSSMSPGARVEAIPNGVDFRQLAPSTPPAASSDVVFCGVMDYAPNEEGAEWLARDVWPSVRSAVPSARLRLVGSNPTPRVRELAMLPGVDVTGTVPDVRPYLWNAAVSAAPLQTARGVQNKVLEAIAAGLPAVITPVVAEGLPPEIAAACRVSASPEAFAASIVELLRLSPTERRAMAATIDLSPLSWERRLEPFLPLLEAAARSRP
jgi:sugar transferase (PEP-CTERM/EpsH1 system associated)